MHKVYIPQFYNRTLQSNAVFSNMFRKNMFTRQRPVSEYSNEILFVLQLASELFENKINSKIFKFVI